MSNAALGRWVKDKWPEVLILVIMGYFVQRVISLDREVGEISTTVRTTSQQVDKLGDRMGAVETSIGRLEGRLLSLDAINTSISLLGQQTGMISQSLNKLQSPAPIQKTVACYSVCKPLSTKTIVQCGIFSPETKVDGRENTYQWPLLVNLDQYHVEKIMQP